MISKETETSFFPPQHYSGENSKWCCVQNGVQNCCSEKAMTCQYALICSIFVLDWGQLWSAEYVILSKAFKRRKWESLMAEWSCPQPKEMFQQITSINLWYVEKKQLCSQPKMKIPSRHCKSQLDWCKRNEDLLPLGDGKTITLLLLNNFLEVCKFCSYLRSILRRLTFLLWVFFHLSYRIFFLHFWIWGWMKNKKKEKCM